MGPFSMLMLAITEKERALHGHAMPLESASILYLSGLKNHCRP